MHCSFMTSRIRFFKYKMNFLPESVNHTQLSLFTDNKVESDSPCAELQDHIMEFSNTHTPRISVDKEVLKKRQQFYHGVLPLVFLILISIQTVHCKPKGFPSGMTLEPYNFTSWGQDQVATAVWVAYPKTETDIVNAVNWARNAKYRIRASGSRHNWAPYTVTSDDTQNSEDGISRVVLLKMTRYFNNMTILSTKPGDSEFWAQTGIKLSVLHDQLERNKLGFANNPDNGVPTLGGALAIGAHGTSLARKGHPNVPGHTHGTMSNLVISFTAVVYNKTVDRYVLQTFHRSHPDAKYFLVNLGRTFITSVTMRVGPLLNIQVTSDMSIPADDLFKKPPPRKNTESPAVGRSRRSLPVLGKGLNFGDYVNRADGVVATIFPYTNSVCLRLFHVQKNKPRNAREVHQPNNYPTSEADEHQISVILKRIREGRQKEAIRLGAAMVNATINTLSQNDAHNIWGTSPKLTVYDETEVGSSSFKIAGYAVLTSKSRIQEVTSNFYWHYKSVRDEFAQKGKYPFTGPYKFRLIGLEDPKDVMVEGAEAPAISAGNPNLFSKNNEKFDTIVYISILYLVQTPEMMEAARKLETFKTPDGQSLFDAVRPEWSKQWAYGDKSPWNSKAAPHLFDSFARNKDKKDYFLETAKKFYSFDPYRVMSNSLLDDLFQ